MNGDIKEPLIDPAHTFPYVKDKIEITPEEREKIYSQLDDITKKLIEHMRYRRNALSNFFGMEGTFTFVNVMDFYTKEGVKIESIRPRMEYLEKVGLIHHYIADSGTDRYELTEPFQIEKTEENNDDQPKKPDSKRIVLEAKRIINEENVLSYIADTVQRTVIGNREGIELIILCSAQRALFNGRGVYVQTTGPSGAGKTYIIRQTLWTFPQEWIMDGSISPQAMFYNEFMEPLIYYIDDYNGLNQDLNSTMKALLTNFRKDTKRTVVTGDSKNRKTKTYTIPARTVVFISAVDTLKDLQFMNRFIPLPVDSDESIPKKVHDFQSKVACGMLPDLDTVADERVLICREILRQLCNSLVTVDIPFAYPGGIIWSQEEMGNQRNYDVFLDLIKLCAIFESGKRKRNDRGELIAQYEDFHRAVKIYGPRRKTQHDKVGPAIQKVLDFLRDNPGIQFTQKEMCKALKMPQGNLSIRLDTLKDMSLVIEEDGVIEVLSEDKDGMGRDKRIPVRVKKYSYVGDPIISSVFDSPLQLCEKEREKPEYQIYYKAMMDNI